MKRSEIKIPAGFLFGGIACGIKKTNDLDLALAVAPEGATAAAVFTKNRVVAPPVVVGRENLRTTQGHVTAVVVNSGNANCATGDAGLHAAKKTCHAVAELLGVSEHAIVPSSTGVIGVPLPLEKLLAGIPSVYAAIGVATDHVQNFVRAIMTTDTRPKHAAATVTTAQGTSTILGVVKGAGMIHPNMATMLGYVFTDVIATPDQLAVLLGPIVRRTFNRISIDGDTSTNDTIVLMASGKSSVDLNETDAYSQFATALEKVCASLAEQVVSDGEGVQHVVHLHVQGAQTEAEAEQIASVIATSPLVKTAWAGADPNWGRILAAIGRSGVAVDVDQVDISFGEMRVCRGGVQVPFDEAAAVRYLSQPHFDIGVQLHRGTAAITYLTCDLTAEYVKVNTEYRT